jgi:tight adherence protein C
VIDLIVDKLTDSRFLVTVFGSIAVAATALTFVIPIVEGRTAQRRIKRVAIEHSKLRGLEHERLARGNKIALRQDSKTYMKRVVDQFRLHDWLNTETARRRLAMAGYRGPQAQIGFLFSRLVMSFALFMLTFGYIFFIKTFGQPPTIRLSAAIAGAYLGLKAPEIFLSNQIAKRQTLMEPAFADALDLLLICVEAGMSIEQAFRKVSVEMSAQSAELADELALCTAELSFLNDRRDAYENLAVRTGLESVRSVSTALIQAERYGTPLGSALRTLAQESRDQRMMKAEKKAASLPAKLTVPMILFFLPVLFVVILTPAAIRVMKFL